MSTPSSSPEMVEAPETAFDLDPTMFTFEEAAAVPDVETPVAILPGVAGSDPVSANLPSGAGSIGIDNANPPVNVTISTPPVVPLQCNIVEPRMGGVFQENPPTGVWVAWTGGKPKRTWQGLEDTSVMPTPLMVRHVGSKDVKGYTLRTKGLETKFGLKDDLRAFCRKVMKHFIQCGLDTITYVIDPVDDTKMESIVECPNKFTKAYVMNRTRRYPHVYDSYDALNDRTARDFVIDSLSSELERKVSAALASTPDPSFANVWMTLIEKIRLLSVDRFTNLETKIKTRKPTDYPGQNLELMAEANLQDLQDLHQGGWFNLSIGLKLVENFASANSECFEFKTFAYDILTRYKVAIKECFHMQQSQVEIYLQHKNLDFEKICTMFGDYYRSANQDGKWLPSRTVRDTRAPPSNFGTMATSRGRSNRGYNLIQQGNRFNGGNSGGNSTNLPGTCHNCGERGHWAANCPNKATNSEVKPKEQRGDKVGKENWTRVPPSAGAPEKKLQHQKTFYWCAKCKRWTQTHGTNEHKSKGELPNNQKSQKNVNFSMVEDYAAWNAAYPFEIDEQSVEDVQTNSSSFDWNLLLKFGISLGLWLSIFGIIVGYNTFVQSVRQLGIEIIAPLSWIGSLLVFCRYQPLLSILPPESPSKPLHRQEKRYVKQSNQKKRRKAQVERKKKKSHGKFHRSYPLKLRSKGLYKSRSQARKEKGATSKFKVPLARNNRWNIDPKKVFSFIPRKRKSSNVVGSEGAKKQKLSPKQAKRIDDKIAMRKAKECNDQVIAWNNQMIEKLNSIAAAQSLKLHQEYNNKVSADPKVPNPTPRPKRTSDEIFDDDTTWDTAISTEFREAMAWEEKEAMNRLLANQPRKKQKTEIKVRHDPKRHKIDLSTEAVQKRWGKMFDVLMEQEYMKNEHRHPTSKKIVSGHVSDSLNRSYLSPLKPKKKSKKAGRTPKLTYAQKAAIADIWHDTKMYHPSDKEWSTVTKAKPTETVSFIASNTSLFTKTVNKLAEFAPAWFRTSFTKSALKRTVIWDSGASISISPDERDFVGPLEPPKHRAKLHGISHDINVEGEGFVVWPMQDVRGMI